MYIGTVSSKGQITIPKQVREKLDLRPGDKVDFTIIKGSRVLFACRKRNTSEVFGMLKHRKRKQPVSVEEMNRAVAKSRVSRGSRGLS